MWVNYQRKLEYNPPHSHSGDLSFVIYLQVPNELVEERNESVGKRRNFGPGAICFEYGFHDAQFCISDGFRFPEVGELLIFPAWLKHYVFAFKSDVERVSVSGNIKLSS